MHQPSLFDPVPSNEPPKEDLEQLRRHLNGVLRELRRAQFMPWSEQNAGFKAKDFEFYSSVLPADERDQLRATFATELERVRKASADWLGQTGT